MNDTIDGDVARYATAVRAAFADLPGPERELLLEDLEDHLQEVAAEAGGPLAERLGEPEDYAAELRASAGLPAPGAGRGAGPGGPGGHGHPCGSPASRAACGAPGGRRWHTLPAGPLSGSCPSCDRPGGCCGATWPCRPPPSPCRP